MEQYTFEGITYNVAPNRLQDFLAKYPNAEKVEKTQGVAAPDAAVTPQPVSDDTGLASDFFLPAFTGSTPKAKIVEKKEEELGAWDNFRNNISNAFEMAGDVGEFWGISQKEDSMQEAAEKGTLGAYSGLNITSTLIWEGVFGKEKMKQWKKDAPGFFSAYAPSDSKTFQKVIENFAKEKEEQKETMTFKEADSFTDYLSVASGAIANVGGSVAYNLGTAGTGFFMEFAADNFIEANKVKAEYQGKSLEQLIKDGEAESATPIKIAAVQAGLEYVGFSKIMKPFGKKATGVKGEKTEYSPS